MDEANEISVEIESNKDAHIAILRDTLDDLRRQNKFIKKVCVMLFCLVVGLIACVVGLNVYYISQFDYSVTSEVTADNSCENIGNISIGK